MVPQALFLDVDISSNRIKDPEEKSFPVSLLQFKSTTIIRLYLPHLVENPARLNGHDRFEDAIFQAKQIMQERGWSTEITDTKEQCHEHLVYQHYRLRCWK